MATKTKESKIEKEAISTTKQILKLLGFELEIQVKVEDAIQIEIQGGDLGLLIGQYGEHLESLQIILGLVLNKKIGGEWRPIAVDIGGWRKEREESLRSLVAKEASKLSSVKGEVSLAPMPPSQRRIAHLVVSEYAGITSTSIGEGQNRHIVIKREKDANEA